MCEDIDMASFTCPLNTWYGMYATIQKLNVTCLCRKVAKDEDLVYVDIIHEGGNVFSS